jgi:hypothetical protein
VTLRQLAPGQRLLAWQLHPAWAVCPVDLPETKIRQWHAQAEPGPEVLRVCHCEPSLTAMSQPRATRAMTRTGSLRLKLEVRR